MMKDLVQLTQFTKRPGRGTSGKQITIRSNFFEIKKFLDDDIHMYDITFTTDVKKKAKIRIFNELLKPEYSQYFGKIIPVFDGGSLIFSPKPLPLGDLAIIKVSILGNTKSQEFDITIKKTNTINTEELHQFLDNKMAKSSNILSVIQALDVAFRMDTTLNKITFGRCFYDSNSQRFPVGNGVDVIKGVFQSCRPSTRRLLLNVDISHTAFYSQGKLINFIMQYFDMNNPNDISRLNPQQLNDLNKRLNKVKIETNHRKTKGYFTFKEFSAKDSNETTFEKDGKEISISDYFKMAYNKTLTYPKLVCVKSMNGITVPLEFCDICPTQRYIFKLNEKQTSEMIKISCQKPDIRENYIINASNRLEFNKNPFLNSFGIKVDNKLVSLKARVLPTPTVEFGKKGRVKSDVPAIGKWNLKGVQLYEGKNLVTWGVISFVTDRSLNRHAIEAFLKEMQTTCTNTGMKMDKCINANSPEYLNPQREVQKALQQAYTKISNLAQKKVQLLLIILPSTSTGLYSEIKFATETSIGVASQCVQVKHVRFPKAQYCANVCLKINAKIGGSNFALPKPQIPFISSVPTIIFGADVTHPGKNDSIPSIATLVASMNAEVNKYECSIRTQASNSENIADLQGMVVELLRSFRSKTNCVPKKIIFYRDGVSEGQFDAVLKQEFKAIKEACTSLDPKYNPTTTFVIVQKRHHARFFPSDAGSSEKSGNCKPGTVIDSDITHPSEFDFYLQSHSGLQGTSRPAHYHVLKDENNFTADGLQDLTNKLCYIYARSTSAVSIVPPVYYSHLAAFRARFHLKQVKTKDKANPLSYELVPLNPHLQHSMFFI